MGINYCRKFIHISFGLILYFLSFILSSFYFKITLFGFFIGLSIFEFLRIFFFDLLPLKGLWFPLFKKEEIFSISDAWFYLLGIIFSWYFLNPFQFRLILLILTLADPVAALVGFYIGRYKIYKYKTLEGGFAFLITTLIIVYLYTKNLALHHIILCFIVTLAEIFTKKDNFWIPFMGGIYLRFIDKFLKVF